MVGLEGAGETEGSRIWGMRASWLMITGGSGGRSNAQRDRLELCSGCRDPWAVGAHQEVASRSSIPAQDARLKGRRTVCAENQQEPKSISPGETSGERGRQMEAGDRQARA